MVSDEGEGCVVVSTKDMEACSFGVSPTRRLTLIH